ncbi:MAG: energy transducer TonB, partial [Lysobacteraceae bacterium]
MAESSHSVLVRSMSAPRSSSAKSFTVHIPRNALKIAGIAFGVGVLLFVLVWLTGRD